MRRFRPRFLAVLGMGAYKKAFDCRHSKLGRQTESLGDTVVWVLPNPSGLNASYQLPDLACRFRAVQGCRVRAVLICMRCSNIKVGQDGCALPQGSDRGCAAASNESRARAAFG